MKTTSGVSSRARSTASSPLAASPTTTTTSSDSSSAVFRPSRVTGWSSTMSARIGDILGRSPFRFPAIPFEDVRSTL
jgi:hypothetical protein